MQNSTSLLLIIISVSFLFLITLDKSNHCLNTARPGEPGAHDGGESASGHSDSESQPELEQKIITLDKSNHCLLNTARPGEPGAHDGGESASGDSDSESESRPELEQKTRKKKKFSLLQKLMRKIHRDKEHDRPGA